MLRAFSAAHVETRRRAGQGRPTQFGLEGIGDGLFARVSRFACVGGENRAVPRAVAQSEFYASGVAVVFAAAFVHGRFGFERTSRREQRSAAEEEGKEEGMMDSHSAKYSMKGWFLDASSRK